jgi:hypothetical protein
MLKQFDERYADTRLGELQRCKPLSAFIFPQLEMTIAFRGSKPSPSLDVDYAAMVIYDNTGRKTVKLDFIVPIYRHTTDYVNLGQVMFPLCQLAYPTDCSHLISLLRNGNDLDEPIMFDCMCRNVFAQRGCTDIIRKKLNVLERIIGNPTVDILYGHQFTTHGLCPSNAELANRLIFDDVRRILFVWGHAIHFGYCLEHTKYIDKFYVNHRNFLY